MNNLTDHMHINIHCNLFEHNIGRVNMTGGEISPSYKLWQPINNEDTIKL